MRNWIVWPKSEWDNLPPKRVERAEKPPVAKLGAYDKLEQTGPISDYEPERASPTTEAGHILRESREEHLRDNRGLAEESVLFRTFYKGGIGMNFDQKA